MSGWILEEGWNLRGKFLEPPVPPGTDGRHLGRTLMAIQAKETFTYADNP